MDHLLFFNHLSTPAHGSIEAYSLLFDTFQGVLYLNQGNDRFFLYSDGDHIGHCTLADGFTFDDFKTSLTEHGEDDLLAFIYEIEDKSPAMEHLKDEDFDYLSKHHIYIKDRPYADMDIIGHAWLVGGTLMSLATEPLWCSHIVLFNSFDEAETRPDNHQVYNIARRDHSHLILLDTEIALEDLCPSVIFSENFLTWYNLCGKEDKRKINNKVIYCYNNSFKIGRPTIDTLNGSAFPNMKEIRVGNAYAQNGKIRILFAIDARRRAVVFVGFIKHNNDYTEHIRVADQLFEYHNASIDA